MEVINTALLTDHILVALHPNPEDERQWLVGDHEKPEQGGFQGEYGASDFVPYTVLTFTGSRMPTTGLSGRGADVWFTFATTTVGKSRLGAQNAAKMIHEHLAALAKTKTSDGRSVTTVQVARYGSVDRLPTEPPLYLITDQFQIFTTK